MFTSHHLGQWMHLAVSIDTRTGRPPKDEKHPQRRFNGRMDEFIIFNEALDEKTILELFQAGQLGH